ncbi:N-acetyl-D-glucosamine kinase N-acetylglucosamine kinase [Proteiniborus sp. DW1]|uniref:N-acetylglucosamine kinase n=1 Tax=Proteiniborus sp. DW1 TaxID=1889883 RepID=UPI00092DF93E|nr:BadF/BadG/BcrA/BcrD ATPase family protein [Proteiniborus sp. DW1]SCG82384.1 N-acetyl-D-glucosamine kinase N-acetylglucosamine kinase [Proteiniborus sp. DW1]
MRYIIGIDGGGTKTIGYLADIHGEILRVSFAGPSNYHSVGVDGTKKNLSLVITKLLDNFHIGIADVSIVSLGLAGIGRQDDEEIIKSLLKELDLDKKSILNSDALTALVGAHGKPEGIITISGTGSISFGMNREKNIVRVGGCGHIIDDEGSGYDIGRMILNSVFKAYDGRKGETFLTNEVLRFLNYQSVDSLIKYTYKELWNKERIAKLAPLALVGAIKGDKTSIEILDKAVESLVLMTETVIRKLNNSVSELCLMGGVFENLDYIREEVIKKITKNNPQIVVKEKLCNGGIGALMLAWKELGINYDVRELKIQMKEVEHVG